MIDYGKDMQNAFDEGYEKGVKDTTLDAYEEGYVQGFKAAQPKWISVEERMPEFNQNVMVYGVGLPKYGFEGQTAIAITSYTNHKYWLDVAGWNEPWQFFLADYEITHWMPLPSTKGLNDDT